MVCIALGEFARAALEYSPINPLVYIMKAEPILWAISLLLVVARGDCFFEIEDRSETEADENVYVDIVELYGTFNNLLT